MTTLARIVSVTSGFVLFGFQGPDSELLMTSLVIDLTLACLTASLAAKRGHSRRVWFAIGLLGGLWVFCGALILLRSQSSTPLKGGSSTSKSSPAPPHAA